MNIFDYRKAENLLTLPGYNQEPICNGWRGYLARGTLLALGFGVYYLLSNKIDISSNGRRCFYALREYFPREKYPEKNGSPRIDLRSFADCIEEVCPVCLGDPEIGVRASCGHLLCVKCLAKYRQVLRTRSPPCPLCRAPLKSLTLASEAQSADYIVILNRVPQLGLVPDRHVGPREWIETLDSDRHAGAGGDAELPIQGTRANLINTWNDGGNFLLKNCVVWCLVVLILTAAKLQVLPWVKWIEYGSILDFLMPLAVMPAIYIWCLYRTDVYAIRYQ